MTIVRFANFLNKSFVDHILVHQSFGICVGHRLSPIDDVVNGGIGEHRIIQFVVAPTTEAHQIDENVFAECALIVERKLCDRRHGLWMIAVHMEYRGIDHFCQVRTVTTGSSSIGRRCEPNLIVHNQMHCSANIEVGSVGHHQHLLIDALTGECCITVQLHIQDVRRQLHFRITAEHSIAQRLLFRPRLAHRYRIHCL